jgi:hypothetical protein
LLPRSDAPQAPVMAPPGVPTAPSNAVTNAITSTGLPPEAFIATGPMGEAARTVLADRLKQTDPMKEAAASGFKDPAAYKTYLENAKRTPEQQAAEQAGMSLPEYQANAEAAKALAGDKAKRMGEYINAGGKPARDTINTLNTIQDAIEHSNGKIITGPGANEWGLKFKQAAANLGFPVEGLPESEVVQKMNVFLASEATKMISARPAMFEFQQNMKANPGLGNSIEGTKMLVDILRQGAEQNIKLGRLAMDDKNFKNWGQVEQSFYDNPENQIRSPFTGKVMGSSAQTAAPAGKAPVLDRARAAIAKGAPREAVIEELRKNGVDPGGL